MINKTSPIIIIGMHRSGTSLITRMIKDSGVFLGDCIENNDEALKFIKINNRILAKCQSRWDNPFSFTRNYDAKRDEIIDFAKNEISKKKILSEYGDKIELGDYLWGWKDPRNTITLDIWKNIFPDAKIIHIYRNPIDVAQSLRIRKLKPSKKGALVWGFIRLMDYLEKLFFVNPGIDLVNIDEGIRLWEEYVEKAFSYKGDILHIKYEEFLEQPENIINSVSHFIEKDLIISEEYLGKINIDRQYSFTKNKELLEKYNEIKDNEIIKSLGYSNICTS